MSYLFNFGYNKLGGAAYLGNVTYSTNTQLTSNLVCDNLSITDASTLTTANYMIFVRNILFIDANCTIENNGTAAGGLIYPTGTLSNLGAGGAGGAINGGAADPGNSVTAALGREGGSGGTGDTGFGANGLVTAPTNGNGGVGQFYVWPTAFNFVQLARTARLNGGSGGGGGGGSDGLGTEGGGYGGNAAGIVFIVARYIYGAGSITAIGGNGEDAIGKGGDYGGGGGGGGGCIFLCTQNIKDLNTFPVNMSVAGGSGGQPVNSGDVGADGADGRIILMPWDI